MIHLTIAGHDGDPLPRNAGLDEGVLYRHISVTNVFWWRQGEGYTRIWCNDDMQSVRRIEGCTSFHDGSHNVRRFHGSITLSQGSE